MALPSESTSTALSRCIGGTRRSRSQIDQQQRDHRDHQHRGGDVDAAQIVGHEERHQRRKIKQGLHP